MHVSVNQGEVVEGTKYSVVIVVGLLYKFDARTTKTHTRISQTLR